MECVNSLRNLETFKIRNIDDSVRFWMVRTKKGYFYEEFICKKFIALGWNIITASTNLDNEKQLGDLKNLISLTYGDSRPMGSINKCKSFIYQMKKGDYVIIPNNGSEEIAIAIVGDYFEELRCDEEEEIVTIKKIENHECEISQVECPYKKRRHIKVLKIVNVNTLSYKLKKAISSYHGISNFDDYAIDILNGVYDCYAYYDDVHLAVNITKEEELRPREISRLMYALTEFFCGLVEEETIFTAINLNSPGSIRIKLKDGFQKLKQARVPLIFLFLAVTGGSGLGFELPGLSGTIKEFLMMPYELEEKQVDINIKKEEEKAKEIENAQAILSVIEQAKKQGIDAEELFKQLGMLQDIDKSLLFKSKEDDINCNLDEEEDNGCNLNEEKE